MKFKFVCVSWRKGIRLHEEDMTQSQFMKPGIEGLNSEFSFMFGFRIKITIWSTIVP